MKQLSTRNAAPEYLEAFRTIVSRIEQSLQATAKLKKPVKMHVAGGAALHFYTGARISEDIDATFSRRLLLPRDLEVTYRDTEGMPRLLYFDRQYNDAFGLTHEDAGIDSIPLKLQGIDPAIVDVRLLTPIDLAVSKLARFEDVDLHDIRALAAAGLLDPEKFRHRAEEALAAYVGVPDRVRLSLKLACRIVEEAAPDGGKRTPPRKR